VTTDSTCPKHLAYLYLHNLYKRYVILYNGIMYTQIQGELHVPDAYKAISAAHHMVSEVGAKPFCNELGEGVAAEVPVSNCRLIGGELATRMLVEVGSSGNLVRASYLSSGRNLPLLRLAVAVINSEQAVGVIDEVPGYEPDEHGVKNEVTNLRVELGRQGQL
jgi:hypothetical protein